MVPWTVSEQARTQGHLQGGFQLNPKQWALTLCKEPALGNTFSCSFDHNFGSTLSIFIILGFLEVERYLGENEVDHDSQDTVQSCTYPAIAVECSDDAKNTPKAQTRPAPAISFFLIADFWCFAVHSWKYHEYSEAPGNLSKSGWRKVSNSRYSSRSARFWNCRDRGSTYKWFISRDIARSASQIVSTDSWEFSIWPGYLDRWIRARFDWVTIRWSFAFLPDRSCALPKKPKKCCSFGTFWGFPGNGEPPPPAYAPGESDSIW